jgi:predicted kinase
MVIIVTGLPGSGKSYFAGRLAEAIGAQYFSSDQFRKKFFSGAEYSHHEKFNVYKKLLSETLNAVDNEKDIVLDATFYKQIIRDEFISALEAKDEKIIFIEIKADKELIRERVKVARKDSDADYEVYKKILSEYEPITANHLTLFSGKENIQYMLKEALEYVADNS